MHSKWLDFLAIGVVEGTLIFCFLAIFYFSFVKHKERETTKSQLTGLFDQISTPEQLQWIVQSLPPLSPSAEKNNEKIYRQVIVTMRVMLVGTLVFLVVVHPYVSVSEVLKTSVSAVLMVALIEYLFLTHVSVHYRTVHPSDLRDQIEQILAKSS